jgi:hypothetical protein
VKPPGTIVRHDAHEYLLVEGGYSADTRAIIFLARLDNPLFPLPEGNRAVSWGPQGEWTPVARWNAEGLHLPDSGHAAHTALAQSVIDEYKAARPPQPVLAWAARRGTGFAGGLHPALPMGFAASVHDTREAAAAEDGAQEIVPIDNLAMFFTHLVREGYAGAVWDERPLFFCVDEREDLQYLRVSPPEKDGGEPVFEILGPDNRFGPYDGAEQIEFIDNRDDCDARLVEALGRVALLDWPPTNRLWSLGPRLGTPAVVQPQHEEGALDEPTEDAVPHGLLFTSEEAADAFRRDAAPDLVVFPVNDVAAFLSQPPLAGCVAALNPGGHRATSGLLWHDGQRVVLDSFSGFWRYASGQFELLKE